MRSRRAEQCRKIKKEATERKKNRDIFLGKGMLSIKEAQQQEAIMAMPSNKRGVSLSPSVS